MTFIDTNLLVYAAVPQDAVKMRRAREVLADLRRGGTGVLSLQVLREFANALYRKSPLSAPAIHQWFDAFAAFPCVGESLEMLRRGMEIKARHGLQYYDALVVAAAESAGCDTIYSEDMADDVYEGIRVVNPFASAQGEFSQRSSRL